MQEVDASLMGLEETDEHLALLEQLEDTARAALVHLELSPAILSLVLCDDASIQPLNRDWRGKDAPTDVLSFAQQEGEGMLEGDPVLGDLVISLDTARRQAEELGHGLEHELRVLLVHGLMHLLGYDHIEDDERVEMQAAEARLLRGLGDTGASLTARATAE